MRILIPLLFTIVISISSFAQGDLPILQSGQTPPTVLSALLKPASHIGLYFSDEYYQDISFKNLSKKDTIITKNFDLLKPTLLAYNSMLMLPNGPLQRSYPILLVPGDTVVLRNGKDGAILIDSSTGIKKFADSIIYFPKSYHWSYDEDGQFLKTKGLQKMIEKIEGRFIDNEAAIADKNFSKAHLNVLKKVNSNIKYTSIAKLLSDKQLSTSGVTDSLYNDLYKNIDEINSINTINNMLINAALIRYNAIRKNQQLNKGDIWNWIPGVDAELKHTAFYQNYLTSLLVNTFTQTPEDLSKINGVLSNVKSETPALDTLYQASNILKETFTNFAQAKEKLKTFANGRYSFIIENDEKSANHELKTIKNLTAVMLTNFSGKKTDLKAIISNGKYKLTVIDFWASWCVPCIAEIPSMKKMENKFKAMPIKFIGVSIDENNQVGKWVEAAKKNKIFDSPFQYHLADFKKSSLIKLINLQSIPRYIIIDNNGNIIDEDFLRPSDPQFEFQLMKHLDNYSAKKVVVN